MFSKLNDSWIASLPVYSVVYRCTSYIELLVSKVGVTPPNMTVEQSQSTAVRWTVNAVGFYYSMLTPRPIVKIPTEKSGRGPRLGCTRKIWGFLSIISAVAEVATSNTHSKKWAWELPNTTWCMGSGSCGIDWLHYLPGWQEVPKPCVSIIRYILYVCLCFFNGCLVSCC